MLKTILVRQDGTVITSGAEETVAIASLKLTQTVNSGTELTLGSVCAAMAEVSLLGAVTIPAGEEITLYRQEEETVCLGVFITEKPVRTASGMKLTAFDRVSLLDKDLTEYLAGLDSWPYRLADFAQMVCTACGLELETSALPNGEYAVERFSAKGITGRKLMQWIGQVTGRFCRATAEGKLQFTWYKTYPRLIRPGGADGYFYYGGSLQLSDYRVQPVERVQLQATDQDIGTIWPADAQGNTYTVTGNYLLTATEADTLKPIAQTLYEQLCAVTYTPCTLRLPAGCGVAAGDIVTVQDRAGENHTLYVMKKVLSGQSDTLECTGSQSRSSTTAVNSQDFRALSGKVLELSLTVDGVKAENRDAAGKLSRVTLAVDGIQSQVESLSEAAEAVTQLKQQADALSLSVRSVQTDGVSRVQTETGYRFDQNGLSISRAGSQMENLLDDTGMYVNRGSELVLRANDEGVAAVDVTVKNYLIMGEHARFEDYENDTRTACFWI